MKFIIAHPDHFTQRAVQITLRDLNHETRYARDGLDVIDQTLDDPPDAIVLGTGIPGLGELDAARALRALTITRSIPILFITNDADDTFAVRMANLPAVEWTQLPLDLARIREQAQRLVQRSAAPPPDDTPSESHLAAIADPLTGLYTRPYMLHRLTYEGAHAARYQQPLATLLIGVRIVSTDGSDSDGSAADATGSEAPTDEQLLDLCDLFKRTVRFVDLIGRVAPYEFLLLAPNTDTRGAQALAARIRSGTDAAQNFPFGLDIGIAVATGRELTDNLMLLARAQDALRLAHASATPSTCVGSNSLQE